MSSKIKTDPEPAIYFIASGDAGLVPSGCPWTIFQPSGLPPGSGHISNLFDLGPGPRTTLFEWRSVANYPNRTLETTGTTAGPPHLSRPGEGLFSDAGAITFGAGAHSGGSGVGTIGSPINQYLVYSNDGINIDGLMPSTDQGLNNENQFRNVDYLGALVVDGNQRLISSGIVQIFSRHVSVAWWNETTTNVGPSGSMVVLTPIPDEVENAI